MPKILENASEDILNVARDMILEEGFSNVSIRNIATKCGVATGTIYNYFNSKEEILICIIKGEWLTLIQRIDFSSKSTDNYIDKLGVIFNEIRTFMNIIHFVQYENFSHSLSPNKFTHIQEHRKNFHNQICEKIYDCVKDLDLPNKDKLVCNILVKIFFHTLQMKIYALRI